MPSPPNIQPGPTGILSVARFVTKQETQFSKRSLAREGVPVSVRSRLSDMAIRHIGHASSSAVAGGACWQAWRK